jgi:hypothetical protein
MKNFPLMKGAASLGVLGWVCACATTPGYVPTQGSSGKYMFRFQYTSPEKASPPDADVLVDVLNNHKEEISGEVCVQGMIVFPKEKAGQPCSPETDGGVGSSKTQVVARLESASQQELESALKEFSRQLSPKRR